MIKLKIFLIFIFSFIIIKNVYSKKQFSPIYREKYLTVGTDNKISLGKEKLLLFSLVITKDNKVISDSIYKYNYSENSIIFQKNFISEQLLLKYKVIPTSTIKEYSFFSRIVENDSILIIPQKNFKNRFYSNTQNITIVGNKTVSISVGNNEDLNVNQSLFLKIDGAINDNIKIQAQLSDSQSPISPEGDSKELSSVDQVFIKIYGKSYELAFGELEHHFKSYKFLEYTPKFEGVKISYWDKIHSTNAIALSKGKNAVQNFYGIDGVQGPYYLTIENEKDNIKVVSGSEKVYLNGELLSRGKDYYIDYDEGSIMFSIDNFINSKSFVRVSFQYNDENYKQNIYLSDNFIPIFSFLSLNFGYLGQTDDKNSYLSTSLTEEDKKLLKDAGDNIVFGNGVTENSSGGNYNLIEDEGISYYIYSPPENGASTGKYSLIFSYVGEGKGNYKKEGNHFVFVDPLNENRGDYIIGKKLIPAQTLHNFTSKLKLLGDNFNFNSNFLFSINDKNTFSNIDDNDNNGYLYSLNLSFSPNWDNFNFNINNEFEEKSKQLKSFADYSNQKSIFELNNILETDSLAYKSIINQVSIFISEKDSINISHQYRNLENKLIEKYYTTNINIYQKKIIPNIFNRLIILNQNYNNSSINHQYYIINNLITQYQFLFTIPKFDFYYKINKTNYKNTESIGNKNIRFKYNLDNKFKNTFMSRLFYKDDSYWELLSSKWNKKNQYYSYGLMTLFQKNPHYLNLEIKQMRTNYYYDSNENNDNIIDMAKINSNNSFFNNALSFSTEYLIENTQTYLKERKLIFVGQGNGIYNENGEDVGLDDPDSGYEYQYFNLGEPDLTIHLVAMFNGTFNPRLIDKLKNNPLLSRLSLDFSANIDELSKSKDKWKIYFMNPNIIFSKKHSQTSSQYLAYNTWYEIIKKKCSFLFNYSQNKRLETIYQINQIENQDYIKYTDYTKSYLYELQIYNFYYTNFNISFEHQIKKSFMFKSISTSNYYKLEINKTIFDDIILYSTFSLLNENAKNYLTDKNKKFNSINNKNIIKTSINNKYYINLILEPSYNFNNGLYAGSSVSKTKGFNLFNEIRLAYNLNKFTELRLSYSSKIMPKKKYANNIKLEITAEF